MTISEKDRQEIADMMSMFTFFLASHKFPRNNNLAIALRIVANLYSEDNKTLLARMDQSSQEKVDEFNREIDFFATDLELR